jgi:hypothetical protein
MVTEPRIITFDRVSIRILAIRTDTEILVQGNVLSNCLIVDDVAASDVCLQEMYCLID